MDPEHPWSPSAEIQPHESDDIVYYADHLTVVADLKDGFAAREQELQGEITRLKDVLSGRTMFDAATDVDARWRERIEARAADQDEQASYEMDDRIARVLRGRAELLRSLLDEPDTEGKK